MERDAMRRPSSYFRLSAGLLIQASMTSSRTRTRTDEKNKMLFSCCGDNPEFLIDNFQNAKKSCKNGIRSFFNNDGLDFIESTPGEFNIWSWYFFANDLPYFIAL